MSLVRGTVRSTLVLRDRLPRRRLGLLEQMTDFDAA
jgi:hypothetical protein